jgi:hypothetical protein
MGNTNWPRTFVPRNKQQWSIIIIFFELLLHRDSILNTNSDSTHPILYAVNPDPLDLIVQLLNNLAGNVRYSIPDLKKTSPLKGLTAIA